MLCAQTDSFAIHFDDNSRSSYSILLEGWQAKPDGVVK